jgi:hypothetical protein
MIKKKQDKAKNMLPVDQNWSSLDPSQVSRRSRERGLQLRQWKEGER